MNPSTSNTLYEIIKKVVVDHLTSTAQTEASSCVPEDVIEPTHLLKNIFLQMDEVADERRTEQQKHVQNYIDLQAARKQIRTQALENKSGALHDTKASLYVGWNEAANTPTQNRTGLQVSYSHE